MPHPYVRIGTPKITYEGVVGHAGQERACFRLHLGAAERLDGLLFRGEVANHLYKHGIDHQIGNGIPGVVLPENPRKADFFVLMPLNECSCLTRAFEVTGYSPDLFA
ncbi:MAG: hypothetical protein EOP83_01605 [Verrucomicrobiaceae bacterium]|nr:MAG: hypothetical protein EOP83_01605 [Verrucomicrobiaceae bacterium]